MEIKTEFNINDEVYIIHNAEIKKMVIKRMVIDISEDGYTVKVSEPGTTFPAFRQDQVGRTIDELLEKIRRNYGVFSN